MLRLILKRIIFLIPILIGISMISFLITSLSPSDPAEVAIRVNAMVPTPELVAETRSEMGLDRPIIVRWADWITSALHGDLGRSWVSGRPVAEEFSKALPATLKLAAAALAIIIPFSVLCGAVCAAREGGKTDHLIRSAVFALSALPDFWAGLLLMWLFSVFLGWLPTSGMTRPDSIILPAVTLSLAYIGTYVRLIRAEMVETNHAGWVLFAESRGLSRNRILLHKLLNSLRGSATALAMSIPKLIAGAFVVECIFAWPGIGRLCVTAIFNRDFPVIEAYVLLMAVCFILFNLAGDIFTAWLDPRPRRQGSTL
ncbi:putative uncharacterized protein [Sutterella sp. CAG:351]|uniref:nickel/cobalt ABC transporter permease n=1 Tax=Dakarella massiliensis TaxID=1506471 RepID=UPI0003386034|nr:nickel/cobalt ABC transporter permease [Dakarella massiliensis]CDE47787.1 putative uncharacterized protein [Sutterella sp. CAG:351]